MMWYMCILIDTFRSAPGRGIAALMYSNEHNKEDSYRLKHKLKKPYTGGRIVVESFNFVKTKDLLIQMVCRMHVGV